MALILDKTVTGITSTTIETGSTIGVVEYGVASGFTESGYTETSSTATGYTETYYFESGYTGTTYLSYVTETTYNYSGYTETYYYEKNNTGTTYVTGLTNLSYTDEYGNVHENPYMVIDSVTLNKFKDTSIPRFLAKVCIFIYKDKATRDDNKKFLVNIDENIFDKSIYDLYFSIDVMENDNVFRQAYEYIDDTYTNWKSDEI